MIGCLGNCPPALSCWKRHPAEGPPSANAQLGFPRGSPKAQHAPGALWVLRQLSFTPYAKSGPRYFVCPPGRAVNFFVFLGRFRIPGCSFSYPFWLQGNYGLPPVVLVTHPPTIQKPLFVAPNAGDAPLFSPRPGDLFLPAGQDVFFFGEVGPTMLWLPEESTTR